MPDAITLLKTDHKTVKTLFRQFEKAGSPDQRRRVVAQIVQELSVHAVVEEQVFYPVARHAVPPAEDLVLEALEEHHIVKWTLSELEGMDPSDERYDAKVRVLIESVEHHVEEEEGELFPQIREKLGRKVLTEIGEILEQAKQLAPTSPAPRQPDEPAGGVPGGPMAELAGRVRALLAGLPEDERGGTGTRGRTGAARSRSGGTSARSGTSRSGGGSSRTGGTSSRSGTSRSGGTSSRSGSASRAGTSSRSTGSTTKSGTRSGTSSRTAKSGGTSAGSSRGGGRTTTRSRG